MSVLQNKIDFVAVITCKNANPNGDPLNGNLPRKTYKGLGEITDVCLKRKIRNRLLDMGEAIFVQSDDKNVDGYTSLHDRADSNRELKAAEKAKDKVAYAKAACNAWADVRSFGQVFAFKAEKGGGVSVGVRGPVSIQPAFSVETVDITSTQITKSVNSESKDKKGSDTMGMKHRVDFGVYLLKGSINVQLAELTGFTTEDANHIKEAIRTLFMNDSSSARPEGSMNVEKLYWFEHNNKLGQYSAAKVHDLVKVKYIAEPGKSKDTLKDDYMISLDKLEGLSCEEYDGI
ncbi:type I-C CRISPR-associated protein Cas7/Csd2 [Anaerocolumna cellulosilytica]|uniref:Type I-C CRISPR-associated protein Cas7/Csd2 n=1 Tax=Anaerocolumna cellulosilytica TaxID=433286 RepID=A0A6S6R5L5_9FIRM|nr:type I-C CRISPR-associated protein Cas7/Csd2 [Anaerocolumna cellulosilytica]MBB5194690.1 CRISPR-associated protein Csd2 [Anaerocolumna cellulosilytica]BCJ94348.1 type I-C CRISPR-associated protein Cas7/Csd2 [Anaerocolumna cellulosilytica]